MQIFDVCFESHIELRIEWLLRTDNQRVDYLSRITDPDDWAISSKYFQILNQLLGPHTIDRFAHDYNKQLNRFNPRYWKPGTEAVDAFTQDWSSENQWLCPPTCLIVCTINKLQSCKARGTLIAPEWPSAIF